jgi:hypothetical protein
MLFVLLLMRFYLMTSTIRRLHDTGRTGLYFLINFIPFGIFYLWYILALDSEQRINNYGISPKYPNASADLLVPDNQGIVAASQIQPIQPDMFGTPQQQPNMIGENMPQSIPYSNPNIIDPSIPVANPNAMDSPIPVANPNVINQSIPNANQISLNQNIPVANSNFVDSSIPVANPNGEGSLIPVANSNVIEQSIPNVNQNNFNQNIPMANPNVQNIQENMYFQNDNQNGPNQ